MPSPSSWSAETQVKRRRSGRTAGVPLYDTLLAIPGSPVVALNRALALAEVQGPRAALGIVDSLAVGLAGDPAVRRFLRKRQAGLPR